MADSSTIETIKAIGAIVTPIVLAWIALQQVRLSKKQDVIHGQINGMQEKLIVAEKGISKAEGKEEQRAETKEDNKNVSDVKIVGQEKPIEVTQTKKS